MACLVVNHDIANVSLESHNEFHYLRALCFYLLTYRTNTKNACFQQIATNGRQVDIVGNVKHNDPAGNAYEAYSGCDGGRRRAGGAGGPAPRARPTEPLI